MGICASNNAVAISPLKEGFTANELPKKKTEDRPVTASTQVQGSRSSTPQNTKIVAVSNPNVIESGEPSAAPALAAAKTAVEAEVAANIIMPVRPKTAEAESLQEKKEAVRMFIPWEQPALGTDGGKKPARMPRLSSQKRRKGSKKKGSRKSEGSDFDLHKRGSKQQVFIPGSGTEKFLRAHSKNKITLIPLKQGETDIKNNARADRTTKREIEKARAAAKKKKQEVRTVNRTLAEVGLKDVAKLIRQYAEIGRPAEAQQDVLFVADKKSKKDSAAHTRTVIKCPIKIAEESD